MSLLLLALFHRFFFILDNNCLAFGYFLNTGHTTSMHQIDRRAQKRRNKQHRQALSHTDMRLQVTLLRQQTQIPLVDPVLRLLSKPARHLFIHHFQLKDKGRVRGYQLFHPLFPISHHSRTNHPRNLPVPYLFKSLIPTRDSRPLPDCEKERPVSLIRVVELLPIGEIASVVD